MKRFRFRFQRILEIKERLEEARRAELGEAMAALDAEVAQLENMRRVLAAYRRAGRSLPRARLDAPLLGIGASYLLRLQREIDEQRQQVERVEAVVEERRRQWLEATRQRRVYEILKERAEEAYRREFNRQQRLELDEIGERLYARRRRARAASEGGEHGHV